MLFHSAQKSCQEATWEFPETEIELVLTQAEQKAVAGTWIVVPYRVLAARRTLRHAIIPQVFKGAQPIVAAVFLYLQEQRDMPMSILLNKPNESCEETQLILLFI